MYYNLKESGLRIQKLRKQSGMTQEQLAAKMNTSISNLGKLERGLQGLSIDLLINLALFFVYLWTTSFGQGASGRHNQNSTSQHGRYIDET